MPRVFIYIIVIFSLTIFASGCALIKPTSVSTDGGVLQVSSQSLMWQKERSPLFTSWEKAYAYVQSLELGGYSDWRLPTEEEFRKFYFAFDFGSGDARKLGIVIE